VYPNEVKRIIPSPNSYMADVSATQISASCLFEIPFYNPSSNASRTACPTLILACEDDNLCTISGAVDVAIKSDKIELLKVPGGKSDGDATGVVC
jgi:predicted alpha/beta-hydrolase family hydrolase